MKTDKTLVKTSKTLHMTPTPTKLVKMHKLALKHDLYALLKKKCAFDPETLSEIRPEPDEMNSTSSELLHLLAPQTSTAIPWHLKPKIPCMMRCKKFKDKNCSQLES